MKEIGGFFEIELNKGSEYHNNAIRLNTARSCIQYILQSKKYKKIHIPYYICESVLQPIHAEKVDYEYYSIDEEFMPKLYKEVPETEVVLYVNYFGLCDHNVKKLVNVYKNIIVDNTQAFFSEPLLNIDTIYSARKFFGVADGAYLYTDIKLSKTFDVDTSYQRMEFLLKRADFSANQAYDLFQKNELSLNNSGIKYMSNLTKALMSSIDYEKSKKNRNQNFLYLHEKLAQFNKLSFNISSVDAPMVYPLLLENDKIKKLCIHKKIYVATYWKEVIDKVTKDSFEYACSNYLLPLPIDQRYDIDDMKKMINIIRGEIDGK